MSGRNPPLIFQIAVDNSGAPVPGAALYHYVTNTSIPKQIFADFELTTPLPQPLIADAEGRYEQYFLEDGQYTFVEYDAPLPDGNQLRPPAHHIEGAGGGSGDYSDIPGPDLEYLPTGEIVLKQGSGVGANLSRVETDFSWAGWAGGSTLGGRGISPGYAYFGAPGSQVRRKVWGANDASATIYWTTDNWQTSTEDTSLADLIGFGTLEVKPPCMKYVTISGTPCWVLTSNSTGDWWYAEDVPSSYNADGTIKSAAWTLGAPATRVMADIADDGTVACMVGNHSRIIRTTNWNSWADVYNSGGAVLGGIDTDRLGTWIAVQRDTGILLMSTDAGATWTTPQVYTRSSEDDPYVAAASIIPTGAVVAGNGVWLLVGAASYAYSFDGIHWTTQASSLGSFYGVGFDGVRYFATNPNNGTDPAIIYQLLVSEIPMKRHLVAQAGASIGGGLWLPDAPGIILGTDGTGRTIEARYMQRTVADRLSDTISVKDFGAVADDVTDNAAALQAALDALEAQGGGVLVIPPGIYRFGTPLAYERPAGGRGLTILAHQAQLKYTGDQTHAQGSAIELSANSVSSGAIWPYFTIHGLNLTNVGGSVSTTVCGLRLVNALGSVLHETKVDEFYINYDVMNRSDTNSIWTENLTMFRPMSYRARYSHFRFTRSGIAATLNSMARCNIYTPVIVSSWSTGYAQYGFVIDPGVAFYDSSIRNVSGNFSGDAIVCIRYDSGSGRRGNMEGSVVEGIFTEKSGTNRQGTEGPIALIKAEDLTSTKLPTLVHWGKYIYGSASSTSRAPWSDGTDTNTWDPAAAEKASFRVASPLDCYDSLWAKQTISTDEDVQAATGLGTPKSLTLNSLGRIFNCTLRNMVQDTWYPLDTVFSGDAIAVTSGVLEVTGRVRTSAGAFLSGHNIKWVVIKESSSVAAVITVIAQNTKSETLEIRWANSSVPEVRVTGGSVDRGVYLTCQLL